MLQVRSICRFFLLLLAVTGCAGGPPPPATHKLDGQVLLKEGVPLTDGMVEFRSTLDPSRTTVAPIKSDGTFSAYTLFERTKLPGALEGPHRVTIFPPMGADQSAKAIEVPVPITVVADAPNYFVFRLDKLAASD